MRRIIQAHHASVVILGLALPIALIASSDGALWVWHPALMCVAMAALHYGATCMRAQNCTAYSPIHGISQTVGCVFLAVAVTVILLNKVRSGHSLSPHSAHAYSGIVCVVLVCMQALLGSFKRYMQLSSMFGLGLC